MGGTGWNGIRFAIEKKIAKGRPNTNLAKLVRGYSSAEMDEMAQRLFRQLPAADRKLAGRHSEAAHGYVNLYWEIGEWRLVKYATQPKAYQAGFRNGFVTAAHENWLERERLSGSKRPIPVDWTFERVPEQVSTCSVPEDDGTSGPFKWLPKNGRAFGKPAGQYTVDPEGDRLVFAFDALLPPELEAMCAVQNWPGLYIFEMVVGGRKEVLKIGMFGNGIHSSACSTQGKYCGRFSKATDCTSEVPKSVTKAAKWDSRLSVAKGIAATLTDAAKAGTQAQCNLYICMLPSVVAEQELDLRGEARMSARIFEDGCVQDYKDAHGGKAPRYNVMDGGQR